MMKKIKLGDTIKIYLAVPNTLFIENLSLSLAG